MIASVEGIVGAVARVGMPDEKQWVLDHRQKKTDALFSQVGEQAEEFDTPVMTRATWAKLQRELEELFASQDTSTEPGKTSIGATFLRVTVTK